MKAQSGSAVVSGGASGLGLATAAMLVGRGLHVVSVDLPSPQAQERAEAVGATFAGTDVLDEDGVQAAVEAATRFAPLRVAVCCAGVATPGRVISRGKAGSLAAFEKVLAVNVSGTFNVLRLAALAMLDNELDEGDRGVIVLTASVASFDGQVGQAAYSASKAGVAGMVLPLARDLAEHAIRVMAIAPGTFATPLLAGLPEEAVASLARQVPHPSRVGQPPEFAALVGHIVDNGMLNGEVIRLDGALRMGPR